MKTRALALGGTLSIAICSSVVAAPDIYGKLNLSLQNHDDGSASVLELRNNYSRIGFKGEEDLGDGITAIYQYELGINPDDSTTFTQRNSFFGLKAGWGKLAVGHFDTALKSSQGNVDLFNDMVGDIASVITVNDNRISNNLAYSTPTFAGGAVATINYVMREDETLDDGISASLVFSRDSLYFAVASDTDVEEQGSSASRITAAYTFGSLQLGGIYESYENAAGESESGMLASALYKTDDWNIKLQYGTSDIIYDSGTTTSLGFDYNVNKNFSYTSHLSINESDAGLDDTFIGVGGVLKF